MTIPQVYDMGTNRRKSKEGQDFLGVNFMLRLYFIKKSNNNILIFKHIYFIVFNYCNHQGSKFYFKKLIKDKENLVQKEK